MVNTPRPARDHATRPSPRPEDAALLVGQRHEKVRVEVSRKNVMPDAYRVEVCARQRERSHRAPRS